MAQELREVGAAVGAILRTGWMPLGGRPCITHLQYARVRVGEAASSTAELARAIRQAVDEYGLAEARAEREQQSSAAGLAALGGPALWLLALSLLGWAPALAGGAAFWAGVGVLTGTDPLGAVRRRVLDDQRGLTDPAVVRAVELGAVSLDELGASAAGIPAPLALLLGDEGLGILGVNTTAAGAIVGGNVRRAPPGDAGSHRPHAGCDRRNPTVGDRRALRPHPRGRPGAHRVLRSARQAARLARLRRSDRDFLARLRRRAVGSHQQPRRSRRTACGVSPRDRARHGGGRDPAGRRRAVHGLFAGRAGRRPARRLGHLERRRARDVRRADRERRPADGAPRNRRAPHRRPGARSGRPTSGERPAAVGAGGVSARRSDSRRSSRSRRTSAVPTRRPRRPSIRRPPRRSARSSHASTPSRRTTPPDRARRSRRGPSTPSGPLLPSRGERSQDDPDQPGDHAEHHGAEQSPPEAPGDHEAESEQVADPHHQPEQQRIDQ